jgi:hypothetical protein
MNSLFDSLAVWRWVRYISNRKSFWHHAFKRPELARKYIFLLRRDLPRTHSRGRGKNCGGGGRGLLGHRGCGIATRVCANDSVAFMVLRSTLIYELRPGLPIRCPVRFLRSPLVAALLRDGFGVGDDDDSTEDRYGHGKSGCCTHERTSRRHLKSSLSLGRRLVSNSRALTASPTSSPTCRRQDEGHRRHEGHAAEDGAPLWLPPDRNLREVRLGLKVAAATIKARSGQLAALTES